MKRVLLLALCTASLGCGTEKHGDLGVARARWATALSSPLAPSVDLTGRSFGTAAATDGQSVLITADADDSSTEALVVLFSASGAAWSETKVFSSSDQSSLFGRALAVQGDTIAIGGDGVAVHRRSAGNWTQEAQLSGEFLHTDFGEALALDADRMAVGDPASIFDDSAYVFERSGTTWSQVGHVTPDALTPDMQFGAAVAISGDVLVVGAPGPVVPPVNDGPFGEVYVFREQGGSWVKTQKLTFSGAEAGDRFGGALSLVGSTLVVGAYRAGKIAVFEGGGGTFEESAVVSSAVGTVGFGGAVAFDGATLIAGGGSPEDKGRVETFTRQGTAFVPGVVLAELSLPVGTEYGEALSVAGKTAVATAAGADAAFAYVLLEGKQCTDDLTGVLETSGTVTPCAPYFCSAGACSTSCADSNDCSVGNVCDTSLGQGQCVPSSKGGASPDDGGGCSATQTSTGSLAAAIIGLGVLLAGSRRRKSGQRGSGRT